MSDPPGADNLDERLFPQLTETPEEIEYELRAQEGSLWTGSRLLIGIVAFAFASLAFCLLLPALVQQRGPVAAPRGDGHHGLGGRHLCPHRGGWCPDDAWGTAACARVSASTGRWPAGPWCSPGSRSSPFRYGN